MFPKRFSVTRTPCTGLGEDEMGSDKPIYGEPVTHRVYGWTAHHQKQLDGHTGREIADIDLAMPKAKIKLLDLFTLDEPGAVYKTVGVRDSTRGFHGWRPGIVVELKLVEG